MIAIIGTLVGLLLPAVQAARESARATSCRNNFKQIGLALHHYHDHTRRFPSGWTGIDRPVGAATDELPGWGWASELLPQMEQSSLFDRIDRRRPVFDPANSALHADVRKAFIPPFACASDTRSPTEGDGFFAIGADDGEHEEEEHHGEKVDGSPLTALCDVGKSNYVGVFGTLEVDEFPAAGDGMFFRNSRLGMKDMLDGSSKTLVVGERNSKLGGTPGPASCSVRRLPSPGLSAWPTMPPTTPTATSTTSRATIPPGSTSSLAMPPSVASTTRST